MAGYVVCSNEKCKCHSPGLVGVKSSNKGQEGEVPIQLSSFDTADAKGSSPSFQDKYDEELFVKHLDNIDKGKAEKGTGMGGVEVRHMESSKPNSHHDVVALGTKTMQNSQEPSSFEDKIEKYLINSREKTWNERAIDIKSIVERDHVKRKDHDFVRDNLEHKKKYCEKYHIEKQKVLDAIEKEIVRCEQYACCQDAIYHLKSELNLR